ncbi:MAG: superoxide dismutase [Calditrichales bacterium]|nr:MAG: superoxide dismutase [Calditrichales bacterium]
MKRSVKIFSLIMLLAVVTGTAFSHCQVPCGIYGDKTRFDMLREHIQTIEKSMKQIHELSGDAVNNVNQLVRWVENKDTHADAFTEIVTYYFLAQRIKVKDSWETEAFADYQNKLTLLHQMMVFSMKSKQTTDLKNVAELNTLVDKFESVYFTAEDKVHLKDH